MKQIKKYLATFLTVLMLVNMLPLGSLAATYSDWTNRVNADDDTWTVTFRGADGATVSTVKVDDGSSIGTLPAAPYISDEYYFNGWYSEDGVVTEDTVVWHDITADAKYDYMPASDGEIELGTNEVALKISWDAGTFPAGVRPIGRSVSGAEDKAEKALPDAEITGAVAFDLTFYAYVDDVATKVQPANENKVHVKISFKKGHELDTDDLTVLHREASGNYEIIESDPTKNGVEFDGESFSIYIIVESELGINEKSTAPT